MGGSNDRLRAVGSAYGPSPRGRGAAATSGYYKWSVLAAGTGQDTGSREWEAPDLGTLGDRGRAAGAAAGGPRTHLHEK